MAVENGNRRRQPIRDAGTLLNALGRYWVTVFPAVRRELKHWTKRAELIPDPALRRLARYVLGQERLNSEGAALFAILAPLRRRTSVVRLLVGFQVLYDYLDVLTEQPNSALPRLSRRLNRALTSALGAMPPPDGYYTDEAHGPDGGYLDELIATCRKEVDRLPSAAVAVPFAITAARRSAAGQTESHAAASATSTSLMHWATTTRPVALDLDWWEIAAASESSLVIHALLASAAIPHLTLIDAAGVANAYWPWIAALNALLDDLVDRAEDAAEGTHNYVDHYCCDRVAGARLATMAARASDALQVAPHSRQHMVILSAMASFYLSAIPATAPSALREAASEIRGAVAIDMSLVLSMLKGRRWLAQRHQP
jgi:tetraprenyl-beta-curcumene synthase